MSATTTKMMAPPPNSAIFSIKASNELDNSSIVLSISDFAVTAPAATASDCKFEASASDVEFGAGAAMDGIIMIEAIKMNKNIHGKVLVEASISAAAAAHFFVHKKR